MKYMMLISPGPGGTRTSKASRRRNSRRSTASGARSTPTPGVTPGQQLAPPETATTVRVQDGRALTTDGPFVEIKEALNGYLILEADDLDAAIELASRIPRPASAARSRSGRSSSGDTLDPSSATSGGAYWLR